MRIEPPPSPPVASGTSPPATAAALPADEPPVVRPWRHGLCVTPFSFVTLTFSPPNSLAVVSPTGTAPPRAEQAFDDGARLGRDAVREDERRLGLRPTRDRLELLDADGHAAERWRDVGVPAASSARSGSRNEKQLRSLCAIAASVASSSSRGDRSPRRKRVDERARVAGPGFARHDCDHAIFAVRLGTPEPTR